MMYDRQHKPLQYPISPYGSCVQQTYGEIRNFEQSVIDQNPGMKQFYSGARYMVQGDYVPK